MVWSEKSERVRGSSYPAGVTARAVSVDEIHQHASCRFLCCCFSVKSWIDWNCDWEEPMFGLTELVCVTVIYIPLMLFGLLGNVLTILVVWLRPQIRSSTYLYLSSMAVSDLMILLLLPLDLYKLWRPRPWPFGDLACKMTMFLSECCTFCTVLHITFLSLERYVAICWPITAKTLVTRRRTRALIGCLWLGAAVSAAPVLVMVGVEEIGEEDLRVGGWRENGRWMGEDDSYMTSFDDELDALMWEEKERHGERAGQWNWLEDGELGGIGEKLKQHGVAVKNEKQVQEDDGEQENMRDEGEEWEAKVDKKPMPEIDRRECRCTDYAISSGLLSAMMILSNLYFLVPVCVLGLVYALIGRTLWLRPQSSRREQSHRHAVKMLGVIVLAFVLCWLPFHIGRTIFFFSLGTNTDRQEPYFVNTDESISHGCKVTTAVNSDLHPNTSGNASENETISDMCVKTTFETHINVSIPSSRDLHYHVSPTESKERVTHALTRTISPNDSTHIQQLMHGYTNNKTHNAPHKRLSYHTNTTSTGVDLQYFCSSFTFREQKSLNPENCPSE
uniref:uncharacterized protein LOC131103428 n=1 Tax=Doryrhamphus excisus TaxID=161450 RepID=UPI0025AE9147|nr:uncharacterized protein LOC131103428 [Doryrhamphus excisus]